MISDGTDCISVNNQRSERISKHLHTEINSKQDFVKFLSISTSKMSKLLISVDKHYVEVRWNIQCFK